MYIECQRSAAVSCRIAVAVIGKAGIALLVVAVVGFSADAAKGRRDLAM